MTIMRDASAFLAYPYERLDLQTLDRLKGLCQDGFERAAIDRLCRMLECFLQVTQYNLSLSALAGAQSDRLLTLFLASLSSPSFRHLSNARRDVFARVLTNVVNRLRLPLQSLPLLRANLTPAVLLQAQHEFEQLPLCGEKVWYWTGWSCTNSTGNIINLPLLAVYQKLGRGFTERLHELCAHYAISRRAPIVRPITHLSRFVADTEFNFSPASLLERQGSTDFFNEFWRHFYKGCVYAGSQHAFAVSNWRNQILPFIKEQLLTSGLFAHPHGLPDPQPAKEKGEDSHVRGLDGERFKDKLLVPVPLHLSDEQAFQVIRTRLYEADALAVQWCDAKISATQAAYERATAQAHSGMPIGAEHPWRSTRGPPPGGAVDALLFSDLAATLRRKGFKALVAARKKNRFLSQGLAETLGLPTTEALFPFCLKLIRLHPQITPSFLRSVELFDRHGTVIGQKPGDTCVYLHGYKDRKHAGLAQMHVKLNAESEQLVRFLEQMTAPLRAYLRSRHDDHWRRLLLTCKAGFGEPCLYTCKVTLTPTRLATVSAELSALSPHSTNLIPQLARSLLRPSTMRSTAAVLVFFETSSVYRMAEALGHHAYHPDLLLRYLPSSILYFYRDRWVRLFQLGIIIQAMTDSPLILQATGFDSMVQLDAFLEHHVLNLPTLAQDDTPAPAPHSPEGKTFVCLNLFSLRILLTLQELERTVPERLNAKARHWAQFTTHLLAYLESDADDCLELLDLVQQARTAGWVDVQRGVIHEQ